MGKPVLLVLLVLLSSASSALTWPGLARVQHGHDLSINESQAKSETLRLTDFENKRAGRKLGKHQFHVNFCFASLEPKLFSEFVHFSIRYVLEQ